MREPRDRISWTSNLFLPRNIGRNFRTDGPIHFSIQYPCLSDKWVLEAMQAAPVVNVHFARLTRTKLIHSRLLFSFMFFCKFVQLDVLWRVWNVWAIPSQTSIGHTQKLIAKNNKKKTIIFTITSGLCYAFLVVCNLIEDELLLLRHQSRTSRY